MNRAVASTSTLMGVIDPGLELSPDLKRRLKIIDEHDFGGVKLKVKEQMSKYGQEVTDEWLDAGVLALKQYYAIAVIDARNLHAVTADVDEFWHKHILRTRQYTEFCHEIAGRYLHHEPLDHGKSADVEFVGRLYDYTTEMYLRCFTHVDKRFHTNDPSEVELVCLHGGDIDAEFAAFAAAAETQPPANTSFATH